MAKIKIITPSYGIDNLNQIKQSINFEYVDEWIIVYDGNRIQTNPYIFKENEKILLTLLLYYIFVLCIGIYCQKYPI